MKPEISFVCGGSRASIFLNTVRTDDGSEKKVYAVNLQRRYMDRETNEWKSVSTFRLSDLPQAALVLQMATEYVAQREASRSSESSGIPDAANSSNEEAA